MFYLLDAFEYLKDPVNKALITFFLCVLIVSSTNFVWNSRIFSFSSKNAEIDI